ncbi:putative uncharacterized protein [Waddlia chondrophila 2032/99]|uniref:Uncharacterized protein n=1 Tax=Waddlia chondrophila 2032/99 TaxID=765953 RepID=F8LEB4_9BACT|nr:putative uncharacterized protein [Waddlia chondrophila 2032/99]
MSIHPILNPNSKSNEWRWVSEDPSGKSESSLPEPKETSTQVKNIKTTLGKVAEEFLSLQKSFEEMALKNADNERMVNSLIKERSDLVQENGQLRRQTADLQECYAKLQHLVNCLTQENAQLQDLTSNLQHGNGQLRNSVSHFQRENGQLRSSVNHFRSENSRLQHLVKYWESAHLSLWLEKNEMQQKRQKQERDCSEPHEKPS